MDPAISGVNAIEAGTGREYDSRPDWPCAGVQGVITLSVFAQFAVFCLKEPLKLDILRAALCMIGAVCFRGRCAGA